MSSESRIPNSRPRDPDFIGAEAAMHRAAKRARKRAEEVARNTAITDQVSEKSDVPRTAETVSDPRKLSFSQAHGYEQIPELLKLEELSIEARTRLWNVLYKHLDSDKMYHPEYYWLDGNWAEVMRDLHADFHGRPIEKWQSYFDRISSELQNQIMRERFNHVFDLVTYVMRHKKTPKSFVADMHREFEKARLAYTIVDGPPTIVPATTNEEKEAFLDSTKTLKQTGMNTGVEHLRRASECFHNRDWWGSIRESVNAVESVARQLASSSTKKQKLGQALAVLEKERNLHPALKGAFSKLYGFASDEPGIRHALQDRDEVAVGKDEAIFMLGTCASAASYLARKHTSLNSDRERNSVG